MRHLPLLSSAAGLMAVLLAPAAQSAVIEEIVVQARAQEESVRDIPVALTAVSEERMDQFGIESMMDLEALTPQLSIRRATSGSGTSISIRGISSPSTSIGIEQSTAVIIDGVYFPQGRSINEGLFDTNQVSVLKGPQALYFGKNATAGVISVRTNNPGDEFEASIRINNEFETKDRTVEGIISMPVNDQFGLRLAVQASDMKEGWISNSANPAGGTYTTLDAAPLLAEGVQVFSTTDNPVATEFYPQEETLYVRLTAAGDLSDTFSYNIKGSYGSYESAYTGGGELYNCSTLNGVAHSSANDTDGDGFKDPTPLPDVDCIFDGAQGWNDVPPAVAATNPLLNMFGNGDSGEKYESKSITASLDWSLSSMDVNAILNWHDQNVQWVGDQDASDVTSIFAGEENKFDNLSAEIRAVTTFDQPVNFVIGAYYQNTNLWFDQDVIFAAAQNSAVANPHDEFTAYNKLSETDGSTQSVYGEVVWDIDDQWQLTAGLRYHHETKDSYFIQPYVNPLFLGLFTQYDPSNPATRPLFDQTFKDWIPEVTLRWEPTDNVTYYAAYKEGFKSGGFSNSAILSNLSPPGWFDFVFEPEHNRGGEIGVKASLFDNSMLATFEFFHYTFEDLQVDFFNSAQFAYVTENAGGSKTYGGEFQMEWATPVDGLTLSGSLGYLSSKFTDFDNFCFTGQTPSQGCEELTAGKVETQLRQNLNGNTRPGAPKWSGFVAANYEREIGSGLLFGLTANLQYKGETGLSASDPFAIYPSYTMFDANVRIFDAGDTWQVALIGKNLNDERAIVVSGNVPGTGANTGTAFGFRSDQRGSAVRGRQVELEFLYRF